MKAGCAAQKLQFEAHGKRDVVADFDGGRMTSDGGGLLLREANCCLGDLMARLGQCVSNFRQQGSVEHTATDLTGQGRKRKRDRAATLRANQLRLYLALFAAALLEVLQQRGLARTELARAQFGTIRTLLLKVAAVVRMSVRRVWVAGSSVFPRQELFAHSLARLQAETPG